MSTGKRASQSRSGSRAKAKSAEATSIIETLLPLEAPAVHSQPTIQPFAWKDRPALIEHLFPAQQISIEAQTERKAGAGQTLTALGSYWKGRKPLVLVRACVLGSLLPATENREKDLEIFELLMAMDDDAFRRRMKSVSKEDVVRYASQELRSQILDAQNEWKVRGEEKQRLLAEVLLRMSYAERLDRRSLRPEELPESAYASIWDRVNLHLGTSAHSHAELIEQLGCLRFGHRPKVADPFCGGGSIPFEAARLGCDVYASDLNPIACMLTWGAFHIIGAGEQVKSEIQDAQARLMSALDAEITRLGVEHDAAGNRAKAYLYCLETRCPETGWLVPIAGSWLISSNQRCVAQLVPDYDKKRFDIKIIANASMQEFERAKKGSVQDGNIVYYLDNRERYIPIKTLRGDRRIGQDSVNNLRAWTLDDFIPQTDDIFQERLYCVQWISKDDPAVTFYREVGPDDLERERQVEALVRDSLALWQNQGVVSDMPISRGDKTDEPRRTRGWRYWHHLFAPRHLLLLSSWRKLAQGHPFEYLILANALNFMSKLCGIHPRTLGSGREMCLDRVFINQALNTLYNYGIRTAAYWPENASEFPYEKLPSVHYEVCTQPAGETRKQSDIFITDPPYADAVVYEEITEFFIAWLRKNPPAPFKDWIWDSRRDLAVRGSGEEFRREMVRAYQAMARCMPDNGLQIVMFTHQDARVWADMAAIFWAAGLRVTAAWYIATETTSELKRGGYVQGTVILVLRKRLSESSIYKDELSLEIRREVEQQIQTLTGLNQRVRSHGRSENLFNDADLQMAGYAAALRVLTGYTHIEGTDMTAEALRPRQDGEQTLVHDFIGFAAQVANEALIPEGLPPSVWETLNGSERFYLRMIEMESRGERKLDNYQNFAKAFRVGKWQPLMASEKPNDARLKSAVEFRRAEFSGSEFGRSLLRAILYALYELQAENQDERDAEDVLSHLRDNASGDEHEPQNYYRRRQDIIAITEYLSQKLATLRSDEASAARVLNGLVRNEKLGA